MLMETYIYKLSFLGPVHFSSDPLSLRKTEVILHSDTLFSAIVNAYLHLYKVDESFFRNPPFTVSSAFPFYKDKLFVKKPFLKLNISEDEREKFGKKIKKSKFISMKLLEKLFSQEEISISEESFLDGGFISLAKNSDFPIDEPIYKEFERPRATISGINKSTIFYTSVVKFSNNAGLYFLVSFKEKSFKKKFDSAMYLLGDMGIGGERSNGCGLFTVTSSEFENPFLRGEYFMNLSLYHPTKREVDSGILKNSHFDLITRQNWIFSKRAYPLRSKSVRMFVEGSVFKSTGIEEGDIVDTTPEIVSQTGKIKHRIYRNGKLFKFMIPKSAVEVNYD